MSEEISKIINQRASIIDNRLNIKLNKSTIDRETDRLRRLLSDPGLGAGYVAKILLHISEYDILNFANYAIRKGDNKGAAFIGLCEKALREKGIPKSTSDTRPRRNVR